MPALKQKMYLAILRIGSWFAVNNAKEMFSILKYFIPFASVTTNLRYNYHKIIGL
jgi:hypothetical protein